MELLQAVNTVLPYLGEHTVTHVVGNPHPTVDIISKAIDRARLRLLSEGLFFNTTIMDLKVQIDNTIELPNRTIAVYGLSERVAMRGTKLFNLETNSRYFTKDVKLKIISDWDFEDLPQYAALYCTYKAAEEVYVSDLGMDNTVQLLSTYANDNYRLLHQEHMRNMSYNSKNQILRHSRNYRYIRGFR